MVIRSRQQLVRKYACLKEKDVIACLLPSHLLMPAVIADLERRGVILLPSALSQSLHRSKISQALLLKEFMIPGTRVVNSRQDLLRTLGAERYTGRIVTKEEHRHCGSGVRFWEDPETLYNVKAFEPDGYPFVMQPYIGEAKDVRVIMAGDYTEAYMRSNSGSFRQNLSAGGKSLAYRLSRQEEELCRNVIKRGDFPYAHLDLLILPDRGCFLLEISLDGGTRGAAVKREELNRRKRAVIEEKITRIQDHTRKGESKDERFPEAGVRGGNHNGERFRP